MLYHTSLAMALSPALLERWGRPGAAPVQASAAGRSAKDVSSSAVSLAFLLDFHRLCVLTQPGGEEMSTKAVVESVIVPATREAKTFFGALVPLAVGPPTAFASHAWGCPAGSCTEHAAWTGSGFAPPSCPADCPVRRAGCFSILVDALKAHFADANPDKVYVWLDVFAVNQHSPEGDLHEGQALTLTIDASAETLVVLDHWRPALPLSRLWCLYEMGSTPPTKLKILTPDFSESELSTAFRTLSVEKAGCHDPHGNIAPMIASHIVAQRGSLTEFERVLRLRLLLKPISYEADCKTLLANAGGESWNFDELHEFTRESGPRLACIAGGAGEGKSTLAAMLCSELMQPPLVDACHFFMGGRDERRQERGVVIRSLAYQLALRFPAVHDYMMELSDEQLRSLSIDMEKAWELLIDRPLSLLAGTRVVLLFDALDETLDDTGKLGSVFDLLLRFTPRREQDGYSGASVCVIVTTRDEGLVMEKLHNCWETKMRMFKPATLRTSSEENQLLLMLRNWTGEAFDSTTEAFEHAFSAAGPSSADLLSVIVAARQPPSMALLSAMGLQEKLLLLPGWERLFYVRDHCVHMLHRSLMDWMETDGQRHSVDVLLGHQLLAEVLMSKQVLPWIEQGHAAPPHGSYVYSNLFIHLDVAGRLEDACTLILTEKWQSRIREQGSHTSGLFTLINQASHLSSRLGERDQPGNPAVDQLLSQCCSEVAGMIKGKTPEEIRRTFNITNDFTPEEEEEVRRENAWAFE